MGDYLAVRHNETGERVVGVSVEVDQVIHGGHLDGFTQALGEVPNRIFGVLC